MDHSGCIGTVPNGVHREGLQVWLALCIFRELNRGKAVVSEISILGLGRSCTSFANFGTPRGL